MKQARIIVIAVALLLVISSTQCSKLDGSEVAARNSFSEWAVNIRTPYRNENFQTTQNNGTVSIVRITVEIKLNGQWLEKQTEILCKKVDNDWQCDRAIQFK